MISYIINPNYSLTTTANPHHLHDSLPPIILAHHITVRHVFAISSFSYSYSFSFDANLHSTNLNLGNHCYYHHYHYYYQCHGHRFRRCFSDHVGDSLNLGGRFVLVLDWINGLIFFDFMLLLGNLLHFIFSVGNMDSYQFNWSKGYAQIRCNYCLHFIIDCCLYDDGWLHFIIFIGLVVMLNFWQLCVDFGKDCGHFMLDLNKDIFVKGSYRSIILLQVLIARSLKGL